MRKNAYAEDLDGWSTVVVVSSCVLGLWIGARMDAYQRRTNDNQIPSNLLLMVFDELPRSYISPHPNHIIAPISLSPQRHATTHHHTPSNPPIPQENGRTLLSQNLTSPINLPRDRLPPFLLHLPHRRLVPACFVECGGWWGVGCDYGCGGGGEDYAFEGCAVRRCEWMKCVSRWGRRRRRRRRK